MLRNFLISCFIVLLASSVSFGQLSKKKFKKAVKEYHIKSMTEMITENIDGQEKTRKNSYTEYDKEGNFTLHEEYRKNGTLKYKETTKYDSKGNKMEETIFEAAEKQPKAEKNIKRSFKYDSNDNVVEELKYDGNGKLLQKTNYTYVKENKSVELVYDGNSKLQKRIMYTYDTKGLCVEKKEFNAANAPVETRKYIYQF